MKTRNKALLLIACAVMLVVTSVFGTVAYLTAKDEVKNTFTVGDVKINLDEADVNEYGQELDDEGNVYTGAEGQVIADRVKGNTYKLLPGHTYVKDPTVTVLNGSEQAYVRLKVTVSNIGALKVAMPEDKYQGYYAENIFLLQELVTGWKADTWISTKYEEEADGSATYEFRYKDIVDARKGAQELDALFEKIVMPGTLDNDAIEMLNGVDIVVVAHAIQADGFDSADAAWGAFDAQQQ